jgi:ESX secretion system ATPase EccB
MATTRDQVAAYDYESRRRVTSLVLGADEAGRDPRRRLNRTLLGSTIIGVLVMAAFGIIGLFGGGAGPGLPQEGGAVLVKGTGDRYVMVNGVLHPALNLTSALLVGGGKLTEVRPSAIANVPRGLPVGIQGAPDGLPADGKLARGAWTVCAQPANPPVKPPVAVLVGMAAPQGGTLGPANGVIVQVTGQSQTQWLVTNGRRYKLAPDAGRALGLDRVSAIAVPEQVLDTIPGGHDLSIPIIPTGGVPSYPLTVAGARVGSLIQTNVTGQQYYVVREDGVASISKLVFTLLAAKQAPLTANTSLATTQPSRQAPPGEADWPEQPAIPVNPQLDQPLCVSTVPGEPAGDAPWHVTVSVPAAMPPTAGAVTSQSHDLASVATSVTIAPGTEGALVRATTSSGQDGAYTLVTETGQRYPITSRDAVSRLQLNPITASQLPLPFVVLLPAGPTLDPTAAAQEFPGTPTSN